MRVPGRAWLQFEVDPAGSGGSLTQTAFFEPKGLPGLAYWYLLYPIHALIFRGMIRAPRQARRRVGRLVPSQSDDSVGQPCRMISTA
jgi:hypothetical protein